MLVAEQMMRTTEAEAVVVRVRARAFEAECFDCSISAMKEQNTMLVLRRTVVGVNGLTGE
jgi:hypothetical protein